MFHPFLALLWGIVIGFATAVPIGPVGIICVQRTITRSKLAGLVTGLGAAISDGFLASVGAFSISYILNFIIREADLLKVVGGGILIALGVTAIISKTKRQLHKPDTAITLIEYFVSGLILTVTNPLTAFTFFAAFAGVRPHLGLGGSIIAINLVAGVVIGSCLWWLLLTYVADALEHKIKNEHFDLINKWFGVIIAILGVIVLTGIIIK